MNTRQIRKLARAAALVAAVGLYGCEGQHAASYVASAKAYMAKADYKAAIIEAKNALQSEYVDANKFMCFPGQLRNNEGQVRPGTPH